MPEYILLIAALILFIIVIVLILRDKKKRLKLNTQRAGAVCFMLSVMLFISFFSVDRHFAIQSAVPVKRILSDICSTKDVVIISSHDKSGTTISEASYKKCVEDNDNSKTEDVPVIIYTDQFLNRQKVPLTAIAGAYTDNDLAADKIRITRALCKEFDGTFIRWRIDYELYFGSDNAA